MALVYAAASVGNVNEILPMFLGTIDLEYIPDTAFEMDLPIAPKSITCIGLDTDPKNSEKFIPTPIIPIVDDKHITVKPSNYQQQKGIHCDLIFDTLTKEIPFNAYYGDLYGGTGLEVRDAVFITKPSLVIHKKKMVLSGVGAEKDIEPSEMDSPVSMRVTDVFATLKEGSTCDVEIDGKKSKVPVSMEYDPDYRESIFSFDMSKSPIEEGKNFSITCSKGIELDLFVKDYARVNISGYYGSFTNFNANSAMSLATVVVCFSVIASTLAIFF